MNNQIRRIIGLCCLSLYLAGSALGQSPSRQADLSALQTQQEDFIARFTGVTPENETNGPVARSTAAERAIAANLLIEELTRLQLPSERHRYKHPNILFLLDLLMPPMQGQNVVVYLPATNPSNTHVILGGHYDSVSRSPGADDNASGVAAILAIAQRLAALETRNVHFQIVFFDQEEDDSPGSKAFAKRLIETGVTVHSMHNVDMIGWDSDGDHTVELDVTNAELEALYKTAAETHGVALTPVSYSSTDHQSFRDVGIEAVCLSEEVTTGDRTPHYHKSTDKMDGLSFEFLATSTLLIGDVMVALAQSK